jgi:predicted DNA-binding protein
MSEWTKHNTKYPSVSARISRETLARLERRCEQIGEPRSLVVKGLIEAALDIADMADALEKARRKQKGKKH